MVGLLVLAALASAGCESRHPRRLSQDQASREAQALIPDAAEEGQSIARPDWDVSATLADVRALPRERSDAPPFVTCYEAVYQVTFRSKEVTECVVTAQTQRYLGWDPQLIGGGLHIVSVFRDLESWHAPRRRALLQYLVRVRNRGLFSVLRATDAYDSSGRIGKRLREIGTERGLPGEDLILVTYDEPYREELLAFDQGSQTWKLLAYRQPAGQGPLVEEK